MAFWSAWRKQHAVNGIKPTEHKQQSSQQPIGQLPLLPYYLLPVAQHNGVVGEPIVEVGQAVRKGQILTLADGYALPIHAPTSGVIAAIETPPANGQQTYQQLRLISDGQDSAVSYQTCTDYQRYSAKQLIDKIYQAGIAGLGGAVFPTMQKLQAAQQQPCKTLIINGAECEPYITADDRLMQEQANTILAGIGVLKHILQPEQIFFAIEDNKPQAIAQVQQAIAQQQTITPRQLAVIASRYPSGDSRSLFKQLTAQEIPSGQHGGQVGLVVLNVATVYAIAQAVIAGQPLIERVVTLAGQHVQPARNYWLRLGSPIDLLIKQLAIVPPLTIIQGGPLMGQPLSDWQQPINKSTNCLIFPARHEFPAPAIEQPCIRCGACAEACPINLLPQQLYWFSRNHDHDKSQAYHINDCIECAACAYVCPSQIPLVNYFQREKQQLAQLDYQHWQAKQAKLRFSDKQQRTTRHKAQLQAKRADPTDPQYQAQLQAALARAKPAATVADTDKADVNAIEAANIAKQPSQTAPLSAEQMVEQRKQQIQQAIARAKAHKASQQENDPS